MGNNKKYVVEANFIKEACQLNLSLKEFLLLLYFENADELTFDLELISKKLKVEKEDIMDAFNNLLAKNIISLESVKNSESGKIYDKVSLDGLYEKLQELTKKEQKKNMKEDIFTKFETEFRRPLHGSEIEIIKAWLDKMYNEDLILRALDEAIYNGAVSIRYIDTILYEWHRKGYVTSEDVDNANKKSFENKHLEETNVFDIDWLNEYDKL